MFDTSLLYTVGLIFLATLIGSYLRSRRKDPCLGSFENFHVTVERTDNKVVWGVMAVESTGLELVYRDDVQDAKHIESSYILYGEEYNDIQVIYRFVDQLTPENKRRRDRDIRRSFHPGVVERSKRGLRKFIGTASVSINEVLGVLVGRAKKPAGRYINDESEKSLFRLGENLIGHAGGVFDPLLERFIGHKMVIEVMEDDEVHEHVGIFKNYSPDFVELLDVQFPQRQAVPVGPEGCDDEACLRVVVDGDKLTAINPGEQPVLIQSLHMGGEEKLLNVVVDGGESIEIFVESAVTEAILHVRVVRELDMIVPRTRSLIRHRAERFEKEHLTDIIFDVGVRLKGGARVEEQERRLRADLKRKPTDALAAANLGGLLLQKKEYDEALQWLERALSMRYSLPDNGRKAEMEVRELKRKQDRTGMQAAATPILTNGSTPGSAPSSVAVAVKK
ncbi:MAG: hypothetical protein KF753_10995 [Caldilineaceae bacterium]|nr:hypothetical protein [Caldilineaceae bacterium]